MEKNKMISFNKEIAALLIISAVAVSIVFVYAASTPYSQAQKVLKGNFTVEDKLLVGDYTVYSLTWHGSDTKVLFSYKDGPVLGFSVAEDSILPVTTYGSPVDVYCERQLLLSLP
jgi:hypothetical protein